MTLLRRAQEPGPDGATLRVERGEAGLEYIRFAAHRLRPRQSLRGAAGGDEVALVVLGGRCTVRAGGETFDGVGERADVWARTPAYSVLLPPGTEYEVTAEADLHLVVTGARVGDATPRPARLVTPDQVTVEHRGEGQTYRYIQHLLPPAADAARLILVEVYTPAGNWSSFPPHKHDTEDPPHESYLEEVYYHGVKPATGFSLQRVYTDDRSVDEAVAPGDGDLVLVPRGYHPVAATPGHESYYLNVMAGPTRAWNFHVDPHYAHLMNWQKPPEIER